MPVAAGKQPARELDVGVTFPCQTRGAIVAKGDKPRSQGVSSVQGADESEVMPQASLSSGAQAKARRWPDTANPPRAAEARKGQAGGRRKGGV